MDYFSFQHWKGHYGFSCLLYLKTILKQKNKKNKSEYVPLLDINILMLIKKDKTKNFSENIKEIRNKESYKHILINKFIEHISHSRGMAEKAQ